MKFLRVQVRERTVEITWLSDGLQVSIDGGPLDATIHGLDLDPGWTEARRREDLNREDEERLEKWGNG